ncbi:MAG TPA: hypothetical protein VHB73_02290 [Alphaproteobacteria bacterium]|nr:hypothetical protein [Alphaproteobacteria bacterium]
MFLENFTAATEISKNETPAVARFKPATWLDTKLINAQIKVARENLLHPAPV